MKPYTRTHWLAASSYFKLVRVTSECADSACWLDMLTRSADSTLQFVVSSCHYKLSLRLNVAIWHYDMMLQKEAMEWNNKLTDWLNEMTVWCNGLTMQNESLMRWFIDLMQRFIDLMQRFIVLMQRFIDLMQRFIDLMRRFIVLMRQIKDLKRQIDWWIMSHIWLHSASAVKKKVGFSAVFSPKFCPIR